MSNIKEEIERLKHRDKLIDLAKEIVSHKDSNIFSKSLIGKSDVAVELSNAVIEYLAKYAESLEKDVNFSSVLSITPDDIEFLKLLSDQLRNKPVASQEPQVMPLGKIPRSNQKAQVAPTPQPQSAPGFPRQAILPDVNFIYQAHGKIPNVNYDQPVIISGLVDPETYNCHLVGHPEISFPVPIEQLAL